MPKRGQKEDLHKNSRHRGHDDSHRVTMGSLAPKELCVENLFCFKTNPLHRGTMRSIVAMMAHKAHYKNYK
jgi:hypothetical protein